MKYVLFYGGPMAAGHNETAAGNRSGEEQMARIMAVFPEHKAHIDRFHAAGRIVMVGTFDDPLSNGSMGIFPTREDAEDFVREDPFNRHGLMRSWRIMEWNEGLVS